MLSAIIIQANIAALALIIFLLIFSKKIYPPLYLFLYLLLSPYETYGVGVSFFSVRYFMVALDAFLTASAIIAFFNLWKQRNSSSVNFRLFIISLLVVALAFWIYLSMLFYDGKNFLKFLEAKYYAGPYALIITLAYYRENRARLLFVILVFLQVALGTILVIFSDTPLHIFSALNYSSIMSTKLLDKIDKEVIVYGSRLSGQFANTVQLGFYAATALVIGLYISVVKRRFKNRIIGAVFALIGFWLQLISVTRGIFLALIFGFIVTLTHIRGTIKMVLSLIIVLIIFPSFLLWLTSLELPPELQPMLYRLEELTNYFNESDRDAYLQEPRIKVFQKAMMHAFDRPLFGYGGDYREVVKITRGKPHQAPVLFMMLYGIPAGIIMSLLLFLAVVSDFKKEQPQSFKKRNILIENYFFIRHNRNLCSIFGWITFLVAMTNEMAGKSFMWIILAVAILPWVESISEIPNS